MADALLELKDVTVELTGETILADVTLSVYPGDTVVLIGPSGAGKTVLLKTMAGLFRPIKGHVLYHGHEWSSLSLKSKHDLASHVGMQFQRSALFDEMNAYDNIAFVLREHTKMNEAEIRTRVIECLTAVGLEKSQNLFEHELSGGMRQRLGIARSIALKPEIVFMDDPTAGLDPVNADNMSELILSLKKKIGATFVIVTHDILRAYQFAGRIFLIASQHVLETGNAEETRRHPDARVQQFINGRLEGPLTDQHEF